MYIYSFYAMSVTRVLLFHLFIAFYSFPHTERNVYTMMNMNFCGYIYFFIHKKEMLALY